MTLFSFDQAWQTSEIILVLYITYIQDNIVDFIKLVAYETMTIKIQITLKLGLHEM